MPLFQQIRAADIYFKKHKLYKTSSIVHRVARLFVNRRIKHLGMCCYKTVTVNSTQLIIFRHVRLHNPSFYRSIFAVNPTIEMVLYIKHSLHFYYAFVDQPTIDQSELRTEQRCINYDLFFFFHVSNCIFTISRKNLCRIRHRL